MAIRSVQVTLANNTDTVTLQHYYESICHGSWGNVTGTPTASTAAPNASLPATIAPGEMVTWESEDSDGSLFTGTEAWVKYTAQGTIILVEKANPNVTVSVTVSELIYIHWDNPYAWDGGTKPFDYQVSLANVVPPCGDDGSLAAIWGKPGSSFASSITPGTIQVTELFTVSNSGNGQTFDPGDTTAAVVWNAIVAWPLELIAAEQDINLQFSVKLRIKGSVAGSIKRIHDASKGLRVLAATAKQPSLRKLFAL